MPHPKRAKLQEAGVADVHVQQWYSLLATARTPKAVIEPMEKALQQALQQTLKQTLKLALKQMLSDKAIIKPIEDHAADVQTSTPEQLRALVKSELVKWKGVVQKARLRAD